MFRGLWLYHIKMRVISIIVLLFLMNCSNIKTDSTIETHLIRLLTQVHGGIK
jgi:hypothetical protein